MYKIDTMRGVYQNWRGQNLKQLGMATNQLISSDRFVKWNFEKKDTLCLFCIKVSYLPVRLCICAAQCTCLAFAKMNKLFCMYGYDATLAWHIKMTDDWNPGENQPKISVAGEGDPGHHRCI